MQRRSTLYGRRKGKPLSPRREQLMADVLRHPDVRRALDLATPTQDIVDKLLKGRVVLERP